MSEGFSGEEPSPTSSLTEVVEKMMEEAAKEAEVEAEAEAGEGQGEHAGTGTTLVEVAAPGPVHHHLHSEHSHNGHAHGHGAGSGAAEDNGGGGGGGGGGGVEVVEWLVAVEDCSAKSDGELSFLKGDLIRKTGVISPIQHEVYNIHHPSHPMFHPVFHPLPVSPTPCDLIIQKSNLFQIH